MDKKSDERREREETQIDDQPETIGEMFVRIRRTVVGGGGPWWVCV